MIVRNTAITDRDGAVGGLTADDLAGKMQQSTVRLLHGQFTGSGVIFTTTENTAYVLTAKHNLLVWARGQGRNAITLRAGVWDGSRGDLRNLHADFKRDIQVVYGNGRTASIHEIVYFGSNWTYDVCCLVIRDGGFRSYARDFAWEFEPFGVEYNFSYRTALTAIYNDLRQRTDNGDLQPARRNALNQNYYFFHAGYGATSYNGGATIANVNPDSRGPFRYRMASIVDSWATAYDRDTTTNTTDTYTDVIALSASADSSSGQGDSGGPIFAIGRNQTRRLNQLTVYLVGVTVGYNYHRLPMSPVQTATTFQNNIIADLRDAYNATNPVTWGTTGGPQASTLLWDAHGV